MNYNNVIDKLNKLNHNQFFGFEVSRYYNIDKEEIILIYFHNYGDGNKYRLFHSGLDDIPTTEDELFEYCIQNLQYEVQELVDTHKIILCELNAINNREERNDN